MNFRSFLPGIGWLIISFYLFTLPGENIPKINWFDKIYGDKIVHVGIFVLLVALFLLPWRKASLDVLKRTALAIATVAIIYGIAIEFIQRNFIQNRSFDTGDILADAVGSLVPVIFLSLKKKRGMSKE